jgi:DUF1680 family protein
MIQTLFRKSIFFFTVLIASSSWAQSYVPEFDNSKMKVKPTVELGAYAFNLSDIKITNGLFKEAMERDVKYILQLEPDRLLHRFRLYAGLTPKAPIYTGWESESLSGHTLGHYISACAMQYATSRDKQFKDRVDYIVDELALCQQMRKTGYIGSIPKEDSLWADVAKGNIRSAGFDLNGTWSPWYNLHKTFAGLMDAYLYADNEKAKSVVIKFADWADDLTGKLNDEQLQKMLACEFGGMNEALVNIYALTGNKKYLNAADRFYHRAVLDPLSKQQDQLSGKHSNTQIPKIIGSARRFELTNDIKDKTIAEYFWNTVVGSYTYANGGNSEYEYLSEPGKLSNHLSDNTAETCNTYNMLKLTRHLFTWSPKSTYGDYYERALYNHILASQSKDNGMMCYFMPMRMGSKKEFSTPYESFWCCVGSGIENHVKYGENIYYRGADESLYVNLFIPSELNWKEKNVMITQQTNFPESDTIRFLIHPKKATSFKLRIRKPAWAGNFQLTVNKIKLETQPDKNGYLVIDRAWKSNDRVELILPMSLYTEPTPDNTDRIAILYGPLVLAGELGKTKPDPVKGIPVLINERRNVQSWTQPISGMPLVFETKNVGVGMDVRLKPLYQFTDMYYSVYWDQFTKESWKQQQLAYEAEKERLRELEANTIDVVRFGEMQPERDHDVKGEKTTIGEANDRTYRDADEKGWFSCQLKVLPEAENNLMLTYWGSERGRKMFDIFVEDVKVGTQELNSNDPGHFFTVTYNLPLELTKAKNLVTVKFVALPGKRVGAVYSGRIIRK